MAEGLARAMGAAAVASAGISAGTGSASANAVNIMKDIYDIDISSHISKNAADLGLSDFDLILTMTRTHKAYVAELFAPPPEKLFTLYEYADGAESLPKDISDPFMAGYDTYAACAAQIKHCLDRINERV